MKAFPTAASTAFKDGSAFVLCFGADRFVDLKELKKEYKAVLEELARDGLDADLLARIKSEVVEARYKEQEKQVASQSVALSPIGEMRDIGNASLVVENGQSESTEGRLSRDQEMQLMAATVRSLEDEVRCCFCKIVR